MFVHIVAWKYRQESNEEARELHRAKLRALPAQIQDILSFEVGADILGLDRSFDTGLIAKYPSREAFDMYTDHPAHQEVANMGKEVADKVISVDFFSE